MSPPSGEAEDGGREVFTSCREAKEKRQRRQTLASSEAICAAEACCAHGATASVLFAWHLALLATDTLLQMSYLRRVRLESVLLLCTACRLSPQKDQQASAAITVDAHTLLVSALANGAAVTHLHACV